MIGMENMTKIHAAATMQRLIEEGNALVSGRAPQASDRMQSSEFILVHIHTGKQTTVKRGVG